jgi:deoxyribodipyrimidine photo-lyase
VEWAEKLRKPLVILEALRCGHPWASDRMHRFVIDGMGENARRFEGTDVLYYPYLELAPNAGKGLLAALASRACIVVTDDFPCFFLPRMVASAAPQVAVLMEVVDSNGLLPLRQAEETFPTAYAFRRFLQRELPRHLICFPKANALLNAKLPKVRHLSREITKRWPKASPRFPPPRPRSCAAHPAPGAPRSAPGARARRTVVFEVRRIDWNRVAVLVDGALRHENLDGGLIIADRSPERCASNEGVCGSASHAAIVERPARRPNRDLIFSATCSSE